MRQKYSQETSIFHLPLLPCTAYQIQIFLANSFNVSDACLIFPPQVRVHFPLHIILCHSQALGGAAMQSRFVIMQTQSAYAQVLATRHENVNSV